ncbi:hypothetical protein ACU61A_02340 [Pseudonocardia sichuanensis]
MVGIGAGGLRGRSKIAAWRARLTHSPPQVRPWVAATVKAASPALLAALAGVGVVLGLDPDRPTTVTAISAWLSATGLWLLHRLVPHSGGRTPPRTAVRRWIGGGAVPGLTVLLAAGNRTAQALVRKLRTRSGR